MKCGKGRPKAFECRTRSPQATGYRNKQYSRSGSSPKTGKCYRCEQSGHIARDCDAATQTKESKCTRCQGEGHTATYCKGVRRENEPANQGKQNQEN